MGRVGKGGGEPGLWSGSALFPMESKVARGNEAGEGERAAKFAACKKTPPQKRQAVMITWQWSGLLAASRICFTPCSLVGSAGMGDLSPSGSASWLCCLPSGETGVWEGRDAGSLPASCQGGGGTALQRDATGATLDGPAGATE